MVSLITGLVVGFIAGGVVGVILATMIHRERERAAIQSLKTSSEQLDAATKNVVNR